MHAHGISKFNWCNNGQFPSKSPNHQYAPVHLCTLLKTVNSLAITDASRMASHQTYTLTESFAHSLILFHVHLYDDFPFYSIYLWMQDWAPLHLFTNHLRRKELDRWWVSMVFFSPIFNSHIHISCCTFYRYTYAYTPTKWNEMKWNRETKTELLFFCARGSRITAIYSNLLM